MNEVQVRIHRALGWAIERNPTYLISAALTAVGARLLLVGPADPAGDLRLILLTLGVLQIYEWAVGSILIALHRAKRSPEDQPSLLLVAAVFWTGPLAATIEMIAFRPSLGTYLAAGAGLVALGEMRGCCRALGLRLTGTAQAIGAACVVLLAIAAPLLKMPESNSGANELYLYATWWVFAAIVAACIVVVRTHRKRIAQDGRGGSLSHAAQDVAFLAITIVATAVHLAGMNYGFYCHAAWFYASPLLVALSAVGFEIIATSSRRHPGALAAVFVLPALAVALAMGPFDEHVPVERLPVWIREPQLGMSVLAAIVWWWGYARHRRIIFLHAGNAACAFAAFQITHGPVARLEQPDPRMVLIGLYAVVGYFAILAAVRRSRGDALLTLAANLAATVVLVHGRTPTDVLIISLVAGWSALIGLHLAARHPRLRIRLAPILFLLVIPWMLDAAPPYQRQIAAHSAGLLVVLFFAGQVWRWTCYRSVATILAAAQVLVLAGLLILKGTHPAATALVSAGFALLAGGALISWHKGKLMRFVSVPEVAAPLDQEGHARAGAPDQ